MTAWDLLVHNCQNTLCRTLSVGLTMFDYNLAFIKLSVYWSPCRGNKQEHEEKHAVHKSTNSDLWYTFVSVCINYHHAVINV